MLRKLPAADYSHKPPLEITEEPLEDPRMTELFRLATELGFQLTSHETLARELFLSMSKRLVPRIGDNVYQAASFMLEGYSLRTMEALLPTGRVDGSNTWSLKTTLALRLFLADRLVMLGNLSAGISRGQKSPSQAVIRVVATMIPPLHLSWWQPTMGRRGRVQIDFMYVLVQDTGELHAPKDNTRRELELTDFCIKEARVAALQDMLLLAQQGHPLSPNWWRQLGNQSKAQEMEARLHALTVAPALKQRRKRAPSTAMWDIEEIVAERRQGRGREFLVQWAGYEQSWEAWREPDWEGEIGDPVQTWELHKTVHRTSALQEWEERQEEEG